ESLVVYYRPPDAQYTTTSLSVGYDELTGVPAGREIISPRTATLNEYKSYSYRVYIKTAGGVLLAAGDETDL
ncbi:MAG: hypothetical protein LBB68_05745, partial [Treponema sp.]|nr:hypothetical protein [Treponema sp.]